MSETRMINAHSAAHQVPGAAVQELTTLLLQQANQLGATEIVSLSHAVTPVAGPPTSKTTKFGNQQSVETVGYVATGIMVARIPVE